MCYVGEYINLYGGFVSRITDIVFSRSRVSVLVIDLPKVPPSLTSLSRTDQDGLRVMDYTQTSGRSLTTGDKGRVARDTTGRVPVLDGPLTPRKQVSNLDQNDC